MSVRSQSSSLVMGPCASAAGGPQRILGVHMPLSDDVSQGKPHKVLQPLAEYKCAKEQVGSFLV